MTADAAIASGKTCVHCSKARFVVSERLGHATAQLTLDTCNHVLPGMQRGQLMLLRSFLRLPLPPKLPTTRAPEKRRNSPTARFDGVFLEPTSGLEPLTC